MPDLKKLILKYLPLHYFKSYQSYAQEGEDMVLRSFYEGNKNYKGFYVDVGAHHPYRFSNTLFFYKSGWRGINIEPTPGAIKLFNRFRKNDINLNIGISAVSGILPFYCFNEPALNGFSKEVSEERNNSSTKYHLIKEISIQTLPLSTVLDKHLKPGQQIDFLTIDVEGLDIEVLESNNWEKYKPDYILVEGAMHFEEIPHSPIYQLLHPMGYGLVAKTLRTLFFKLNKA